MTLDEAIEILKSYEDDLNFWNGNDSEGAVQLGIEALKKWKVLREGRAGIIDPRLPGETLE